MNSSFVCVYAMCMRTRTRKNTRKPERIRYRRGPDLQGCDINHDHPLITPWFVTFLTAL